RSSCQSNLKQIGLGIMQYMQDYEEKTPNATVNLGWANQVRPYIKSTQIFQCSSEKNSTPVQTDPKLTGYTDYFYNAQLNQIPLAKFEEVSRVISAADGNDGQENTNAAYAKTEVPPAWRTDTDSPSFRHLDYGNYLFLDGHVKSVKVERISTAWSKDDYFFQAPK
ncbi:DUF1559 domain-containing protein, partial [bacterium]